MRPSVPERASYGAELKINPQPSPELEAEDAEQAQFGAVVHVRRVDDQPLPADPRTQADVASQHELHRGRFMDAYAAPAARCIAVAADVAAVADARAFPEEPSAPGPLPGDELRRDVVDTARAPDPVAFGRDESARVDDSGAEAPARRPVVPGTDVVAFVQRAGGAFGQVKRRDDGRIRRVGKERVLRAVARGEVLRPEGLRPAPLRDLLPGRWCRFPGYGGERAAQCSARRFLYRGFRPGRLRPELRGSARSQ